MTLIAGYKVPPLTGTQRPVPVRSGRCGNYHRNRKELTSATPSHPCLLHLRSSLGTPEMLSLASHQNTMQQRKIKRVKRGERRCNSVVVCLSSACKVHTHQGGGHKAGRVSKWEAALGILKGVGSKKQKGPLLCPPTQHSGVTPGIQVPSQPRP